MTTGDVTDTPAMTSSKNTQLVSARDDVGIGVTSKSNIKKTKTLKIPNNNNLAQSDAYLIAK